MKESFIKNKKLLKENFKSDDLFDFGDSINSLDKILNEANNSILLGYLGKFGAGKSTLIHNVKEKRKKRGREEKWIQFDAWKFPERKDLWDGFVLEVAKELGDNFFKIAKKKIAGNKSEDKALLDACSSLPGLKVLKSLENFIDDSPAKRVFEFQAILKGVLENVKEENIFIVVEDIDRSGDRGIFFLETLNYFLKEFEINKKIIVIVPISNKNFDDKKDYYLKCLDLVEFFGVENYKFDKFIQEIFKEDYLGELEKNQLSSLFSVLFRSYGFTPRLLKFIIRKADINFTRQIKDEFEPDFRFTIMFEISKYLEHSNRGEITFFEGFKKDGNITKSSANILYNFLKIVYKELENFEALQDIQDTYGGQDIDFIFFDFNEIRNNFPNKKDLYKKTMLKNNKRGRVVLDFYLKY